MVKASRFSSGFLVGFGLGFVSRDLMAANDSFMRPVVKGLIKTGVTVLEKGRESVAHLFETVEDLLAEIRSEKKSEKGASIPEAPTQVKVTVSKSS